MTFYWKYFTSACLFLSIILISSCDDSTTPDPKNGNEATIQGRDLALQLYQTEYLGSNLSLGELGWTGSIGSCEEGQISQIAYGKTLQRINYFRTICGLSKVGWNDLLHPNCQKLALIFDANDNWSHDPPSNWKCYDAAAAAVGKNCNVSYGYYGPVSIDSWMEELGSWNSKVIHRRWILFARAKNFGYGTTPGGSALQCIVNTSDQLPSGSPPFIAYPPKFIPQQLVYDRWSFGITNPTSFYSGVNFDNATVSVMDADGKSISVSVIERTDNGYGDQTIVWEPSGINKSSADDVVYTVKIEGVLVNDETKDYEYKVTLFKP